MLKPRKSQAHQDALVTVVWKVIQLVCWGHVATSHLCLPPSPRWHRSQESRSTGFGGGRTYNLDFPPLPRALASATSVPHLPPTSPM